MAEKEQKVKTHRLQVFITESAFQNLKHMAVANRTTMTGEVEMLIRDEVEKRFPELNDKSVYD